MNFIVENKGSHLFVNYSERSLDYEGPIPNR